MTQPYVPRLDYLPPCDWRSDIAGRLVKLQAKASRTWPRPQSAKRGIASGYEMVGLKSYAAGFPNELVRDALAKAAQAYLEVFEMRGTEPAFPVTLVTLDPTKRPGDPGFERERRQMHPPGTMDHSVTNSKQGFKAACIALAGDDPALADQLAASIWDPPGMHWLTAGSTTCTPNDQHLSYAVRNLFAGDVGGVEPELSKINIIRKDQLPLRHQRTMVRALAARQPEAFVSALKVLLDWHADAALAERERHPFGTNYYLCLPGIGLSSWAVRHGVIGVPQLPRDDVYLPLELVAPLSR